MQIWRKPDLNRRVIAEPLFSKLDQVLTADGIQRTRSKNVVKSARHRLTSPRERIAKFLFFVTMDLAIYVDEIKVDARGESRLNRDEFITWYCWRTRTVALCTSANLICYNSRHRVRHACDKDGERNGKDNT